MSNLNQMVDFICAEDRQMTVLKADGSTSAWLTPPNEGFERQWVEQYLEQEFRLGNFQDVMKRKGYGSIFLSKYNGAVVKHFRVFKILDTYEVQHLD